jgi:hypothetical protein
MSPKFVRYFEVVARLVFEEKSPYAELRRMFQESFIQRGFVFDSQWEWNLPQVIEAVPIARPGLTKPLGLRTSHCHSAMPQLAEVSEAGEVHNERAKWARFGRTRKADGQHHGAIRIPDVRVRMGVGALRREACAR